jgi:hypothetical protein
MYYINENFMSDKNLFDPNKLDAAIWTGLQQLSELPGWLSSVKDNRLTYQVLSRIIPEFASGKLILKKSKIGHMNFEGSYWLNTCELQVSLPDGSGEEKFQLQGILFPPGLVSWDRPLVEGSLGTQGWHAVIPELNLELKPRVPEPALFALDLLTDPEMSRSYLEKTLRTASPAYRDIQIHSCEPEVVRYKAGDRCTILYYLKYASDKSAAHGWPDMVVAKINRGEKGRVAYESLTALWNSPFGTSSNVRIAEPLAYDPELHVFVQGHLQGEESLAELISSAVRTGTPEAVNELNEVLGKVAKGIAELHQSQVSCGQPVVWQDEMAEVREQVEQLSRVFPNLAEAVRPFLEKLSQLEAAIPPDSRVPSHGTFRPTQILLQDGEVSFIDFDSFCQSEPENDLSLFLATVERIGMSPSPLDKGKPPDQTIANPAVRQARFEILTSICERFLNVYEQVRLVSRRRLALWMAINIFHYVLSGWLKDKPDEIFYLMDLLERYLIVANIIQ